jgi:hypothetical protein
MTQHLYGVPGNIKSVEFYTFYLQCVSVFLKEEKQDAVHFADKCKKVCLDPNFDETEIRERLES